MAAAGHAVAGPGVRAFARIAGIGAGVIVVVPGVARIHAAVIVVVHSAIAGVAAAVIVGHGAVAGISAVRVGVAVGHASVGTGVDAGIDTGVLVGGGDLRAAGDQEGGTSDQRGQRSAVTRKSHARHRSSTAQTGTPEPK